MAPFSPSSRWSYMKNIKSPSGSLVIFTPENVRFAITLPPTLLSGCEKAKPRRLPAARVFRAGWTSWYILAHDHRKPAVLSTASVSSFASTIVLTLYFATHPPLSLLARDACSVVDLRHLYRAANGPPHKKCFTERSEEHTSELQSRGHLVCRLLLEKKKKKKYKITIAKKKIQNGISNGTDIRL